jgi:uncharacterized protein YbbK (DUF523 family)
MKGEAVIVSACLLGIRSRYDGTDSYNEEAAASLKGSIVIPVCPEQLCGLPTPRPEAMITTGDGTTVLQGKALVKDSAGEDVTKRFMKGAEEVLRIARLTGARRAVLKEKSPSCGVKSISRENKTVSGMGVTAALLRSVGIELKGVG